VVPFLTALEGDLRSKGEDQKKPEEGGYLCAELSHREKPSGRRRYALQYEQQRKIPLSLTYEEKGKSVYPARKENGWPRRIDSGGTVS